MVVSVPGPVEQGKEKIKREGSSRDIACGHQIT